MAGLDDILGGILGGGGDQSSAGGGLGDLLGGLLGGGSGGTGQGGPDLGAILGNLTGGSGGGGGGLDLTKLMALAGPLLGMLQGGGLSDLLGKITGGGLGEQAASWTGTGDNAPVDPGSLAAAVGPDTVQSLAEQSGLSVEETQQGLAAVLPGLVDTLSPGGELADTDTVDSALGQISGLAGGS